MSKNTFSITGNTIYISRPEWDFIAQATLLFGNVFIKSVCYDMNMDRGNACYLEGDIELASYEEHYYRDTFVGYNVVLAFDEKTLVPSNTFSAEMIDHFKSDEKQIVQYGKIKNDGICIWSICTTEK